MKSRIKLLLALCAFLSLLMAEGCSKSEIHPSQNANSEKASEAVELNVWSYSSGLENCAQLFESQNKGVKVNITVYDYAKSNEAYMKALASGTGPDLLVIDSGFFGQYTVNGLLQNLLEEPYSAEKYKKDFIGWESGMSIDNTELLALTYLTSPVVTYYREDIMKKNGFPSEPDEFGKFIEKPENLLDIAKKLKQQDQYIFQWPTDIPNLMGSSVGIFDENLNFKRFGDLFSQGLDIAKMVHKLNLEEEVSFWEDSGKKAVQNDKLVMLYNVGSWGTSTLESYAPEQKGKWRVTKPPLGIVAWASDSKMAINALSDHKDLAWKFMQLAIFNERKDESVGMVPGYKPAWNNPKNMQRKNAFLGGQKDHQLYESLVSKMHQYKLTPLDSKALELFSRGIADSVGQDMDSSTSIKNIVNRVEQALEEDRKALLE